ncbi:tape measure protein [Chitinophaga agrisoli]|uniref:Tape measure protein n=1 Tax=Chitinophaga agrisoli TaxID=2607653 RepID=A0A5B2W1C1_9BACT|nr:tape measure protein [Chitinophaga agrisoli]KAA2244570.1 tape measure protein [Chitinophaga agrisoli]
MAETTSEELYQMGAAAEFANSHMTILHKSVVSTTQTLGSSIRELRESTTHIAMASSSAAAVMSAQMAKKPAPKEEKEDDKGEKFVASIIKGGAALLKMGMETQQTEATFQQLTGSVLRAKALIGSLEELGFSTPFSPAELKESAQALLMSGTAAANIVPTLTMLGDVSRGDKEKLDAMTAAFGKIQTDGKLTSDTLKEMVGAGFDPLAEMARTSGKSITDLQADLEAGLITAAQFTNSLATATGPGGQFFGVMQAQSETAAGSWQQFTERLEAAGGQLGTTLLPTMETFVNNALIPMVTLLQEGASWIAEYGTEIGVLVSAIGGAYVGYQLLTMGINFAKTAQTLFNLAMAFSPLQWVAIAIGAVVAVLFYAWNTFAGFRAVVMGAWEGLKAFGSLIWDLIIDSIKGVINGISGLGEALMYVFQGDWSKAWETGKKAVKDLVGITAAEHAFENGKQVGKSFMEGYSQEMDASQAATAVTAPKETGWSVKAPTAAPVNTGLAVSAYGYGLSATGNTPAPAASPKAPATTKMKPRPRPTADTQINSAGAGAKDKAEGITSGGARSVVINLQKLFDNLNISSTTFKEGVSDMEQIVTESLLRVLNSANAITI